jgi:hypothetical protein
MGLPVGVDRCFVDKYYYGIIKGVDGADCRLLTGLTFLQSDSEVSINCPGSDI